MKYSYGIRVCGNQNNVVIRKILNHWGRINRRILHPNETAEDGRLRKGKRKWGKERAERKSKKKRKGF